MADRTRELLTELVKLRAAWESRVVEVRTGDLTTTLFLNFGEIAAVKASKPGEPIGRMLVRKGLISREHYLEVLERISEVLNTGTRVAFGEVAVGLEYTRAEDVSACLTEQVRALAMRVFQGADAEWTVLPMPENRDPSRDLTMRVEAIFLDAVRMVDDARKGALGLDAARSLALRPVWTPQEIDVRLELTSEEADFVRVALAGDKTVDELLRENASASVEPSAVLTALLATGAVESRNTVTAERHEKPEPRKAPPPLPAWATVDATKAKGAAETAVRARRSQAPPRMGTSSPLEQMLKAEQTFERGREALVRGDAKSALAELESALALNPASVEYQLFVMWTRHLLSGAALTEATRAELDARARDAIRENPQFAIAHFVLSAVHDSSGRSDEAKAELARARDLDRELFHSAHVARPAANKAPGAAAQPRAAIVAQAEPAKAAARPASSAGMRVAMGIIVVALAVVGVVAYQATRSNPVSPAPSSSVAPIPAVAAPQDAGVDAAVTRDAAAEAGSRSAPRNVDPTRGIVHLPKSALGHRIFVDGKAESGGDSDHVVLGCGHHEIQIGSHGAARPVDVPCGGEIDLH